MSDMILRVAAKAVIVNDQGRVLIVREADTYAEGTNIGKWGMPGGRLNVGEAFYNGLAREVHEEVGLTVEPLFPVHIDEWRPVIKDIPYQIIAMFVVCQYQGGAIQLSDEHDAYEWVSPDELSNYDLMGPETHAIKRYKDTTRLAI